MGMGSGNTETQEGREGGEKGVKTVNVLTKYLIKIT